MQFCPECHYDDTLDVPEYAGGDLADGEENYILDLAATPILHHCWIDLWESAKALADADQTRPLADLISQLKQAISLVVEMEQIGTIVKWRAGEPYRNVPPAEGDGASPSTGL
jgi:hypothetical protein